MKTVLLSIFVLALVACSSSSKRDETRETKPASKLLSMTALAQRHVGLEITHAEFRDLQEYLHVIGTVQPVDTRIGHIRPLARGRVLQIRARVGDRVQAGEILASYDNIEAGELLAQHQGALTELERLKLQLASARRIAERNKELSDLGAIARKNAELSQVEAQSAADSVKVQESVVAGLASRLRRYGVEQVTAANPSTVVRAPFSGVVIAVETAPGDVFDAGRELFSIADLSHVWVQAEVYERDLARVRVGQAAFITVDTYPNEKFTGRVTYIGDMLDPQTRTARVRCEVANPGIRLKLDMFTSIELPSNFNRRVLVVPPSAIQQLNGNNVVFVRKSQTTFETRPIVAGRTVDEWTEVQSGLSAGEEVVQTGSFHLKSLAMSGQIGEED